MVSDYRRAVHAAQTAECKAEALWRRWMWLPIIGPALWRRYIRARARRYAAAEEEAEACP